MQLLMLMTFREALLESCHAGCCRLQGKLGTAFKIKATGGILVYLTHTAVQQVRLVRGARRLGQLNSALPPPKPKSVPKDARWRKSLLPRASLLQALPLPAP